MKTLWLILLGVNDQEKKSILLPELKNLTSNLVNISLDLYSLYKSGIDVLKLFFVINDAPASSKLEGLLLKSLYMRAMWIPLVWSSRK